MDAHRIWELDFLRATAIILMVLFHIIYDLAEFYDYPLDYTKGVWFFAGRISAVMFIIISGVSSNLSTHRFARCGRVLAAAMLISFATYLFEPQLYVRFGILHLLGVCMALSAMLHKLNPRATLASALALAAVFALGAVNGGILPSFETPLFIPLGITPPGFRSLDYYPMFPWAGLFFSGLVLGKVFYNQKKSLVVANLSSLPPIKGFCFLGRHSLSIYLIHQPIIMPILFFLHRF